VRQFGAEGAALEDIGDGVSVLAAPNEFGKSTLFDALLAALFIKHSSRQRDVLNLVPDPGGGAPEIEVDLDHEGVGFRLAKRFVERAGARVIERDGTRTVASGDAVQDWLAAVMGSERRDGGPSGLLWVTQGTSLAPPAGGTTIEALLEQEVGRVVGGTRFRAVLERARGARHRLVTERTRKPKAGSDLDRAVIRRRELDDELAALTARADASECARARLAAVGERLGRLTDGAEDTRLAEAREAAARAVLAAQRGLQRRERCARELELARAEAQRAETALAGLRRSHDDARNVFERARNAQRASTEAAARRTRTDDAEAALRRLRDERRAAADLRRGAGTVARGRIR